MGNANDHGFRHSGSLGELEDTAYKDRDVVDEDIESENICRERESEDWIAA